MKLANKEDIQNYLLNELTTPDAPCTKFTDSVTGAVTILTNIPMTKDDEYEDTMVEAFGLSVIFDTELENGEYHGADQDDDIELITVGDDHVTYKVNNHIVHIGAREITNIRAYNFFVE
jgi:hypothetical protein